jgi:ribonuclease-3
MEKSDPPYNPLNKEKRKPVFSKKITYRKSMKKIYQPLEKSLGYRFKKKKWLELALTHPSFRYENSKLTDDNQRLEYLGDAVLSLLCAEHLFKNNPSYTEGEMSTLRSQLTQDSKLTEIGMRLELKNFLLLGRGERNSGGAERASNIADAVEAILGAAWLDGGMRATKKLFKHVFIPELDQLYQSPTSKNPKGDLQEYTQQNGIPIPTYTLIETTGPEHDRRFTLEVRVDQHAWQATASNKREAEREAARLALAHFNALPQQEN